MKKLIQLPFIDELDHNLRHSGHFLQIIVGPRQVGKTTSILNYLESKHPKSHQFHSAEKGVHGAAWLREIWLKARRENFLLVIDEIQKIENWAEVIKTLWDENKRQKTKLSCVLLGSSSLELHMGMSESLTGRFQLIQAHHWNYRESQEGYGLSFEEYLKYGGYPGSYNLRKNVIKWKDYIQDSIITTVIEKDILTGQRVKSPALFRQAFDLLLSYPAQEISYTKLLGQLQDKGNTELVKHYIKLYEGAFLLKALDKFTSNKIKKRTSSPKILPLCPAFSFIETLGEYGGELRGHVFEALVGATLVRTGFELYYWREGQFEVDYILKLGKKIWAIEVKSGRKKKMKGLDQFIKQYPSANPLVTTPENYFDFEKNTMRFLGIS